MGISKKLRKLFAYASIAFTLNTLRKKVDRIRQEDGEELENVSEEELE